MFEYGDFVAKEASTARMRYRYWVLLREVGSANEVAFASGRVSNAKFVQPLP